MKAARFFLLSFVLIVLGSSLVNQPPRLSRAQTDQASGAPCCGQDETAPREIDFPYYSLRDGFTSTVLLVSDSPKSLDFVMAVRSHSGQTVLVPAATIQPQEKLAFDLRNLLADLGADVTTDFAEGSVAIYFNGTIMPLAGQLTMSNPARSLILESEMVDNSPGLGLLPPVLNAVWWGLGGGREARIMVTNTSGDATTADVFLDFQGGRHESPPLVFAPHEVKVLSINELLGDLKVSPAQAPEGGITIVPRGSKATLVAQGRITDPGRGFSTTLNFPDPSLQRASGLHASGVPIGTPTEDSPYAGTGTFVPHVIVRNLTGSPQNVVVTIEYPGDDGTEQLTLPPLSLGPYSTEDIALDAAFTLLPLPYCSLRIEYSGAPGTVIGEVSSIEAKGDLVIDSRLANEGDGWAGSGANPWHLDEQTESILFLTNMGGNDCEIGFHLQADGVHYYLTDLSLKPHETKAIDLRKLRDAQQPDFRGNRIPAGAADGSVLWIRGDNVPVMGRLVVLQRHRGLASNYDCDYCPCPYDLAWWEPTIMNPSSATITVGSTKQFYFTAMYVDCNGKLYPINKTGAATWSSSIPAVATVSNGKATGKKLGTTNITARVSCCRWTLDTFEVCIGNPTQPASGTAALTVNYGCNDQRDTIIQEYHDYPTSTTGPYYPVCSEFTSSASTAHFTFAMLNVNQWYFWAILRQVFLTGLENTRVAYNQDMTVNSGYRSPKYNATAINPPGAPGSRHVFGDAADIASNESTWHPLHDVAKNNGACVEPHETQGSYAHVHMDWRGACPQGW